MSALDTLRAAKPTARTARLIMDGALMDEWDSLLDAFDDAAEHPERGSMEKSASAEVAERLDAIRDKVKASEVAFTFDTSAGFDWMDYLDLKAAHPPRDGNPFDRVKGVNIATFYPALIRAACVYIKGADSEDEETVPADVWDSLLGCEASGDQPAMKARLNFKQIDRLSTAAEAAMNGETTVPPSARSLLTSQDSGASSEQPSPGPAPAQSGSTAGSPPGSRKSSTTKKARSKARSDAT